MPVAAPIAGGLAAGAASSLFGGSKGGSTTVNNAPWIGVQPYLQDLFTRANNQSKADQQSPISLQAQQLQQQRALAGSPLVRAAQSQNLATMNGDYLNPYTKGAVGDVMDMAKSKINSQFTGDNYGNSAHQEWLGRGLMSASMPYASQAYEGERQRQMGATALAPTLANQDYFDIGQLGQVGQQQENFPWQILQKYQQLISGQPGGSQTQPYFTNPLANALGMGLGGLGLYNGLNQSGLFGGQTPPTVPEMVPGQYSLINPQYG